MQNLYKIIKYIGQDTWDSLFVCKTEKNPHHAQNQAGPDVSKVVSGSFLIVFQIKSIISKVNCTQ